MPPQFGWDAEDEAVLWCTCDRALKAFRLGPDGLVEQGDQARIGKLVRNLHTAYRVRVTSRPVDVQDDLKLFIWPYIGANLRVTRGETVVMKFRDDRGLLGSSWGGPRNGGFLSTPGKIAFQADGHVYVGDVATRTICPLILGSYQRIAPNLYEDLEQHNKEADDTHKAASE